VVGADGGQCRRGHIGAKLGFVRLSFSYFISDEVFEYILEAVHLLADHAWKLLPLYRFDACSGLWHHRDHRRALPTLADIHPPRTTSKPDAALARVTSSKHDKSCEPLSRRRRIYRYMTP